MIKITYGTDLTNLETRLEALEGRPEGITIEDVDAANPYVGISRLHTLPLGYTSLPGGNDNKTFFEYFKEVGSSGSTDNISRFGVFVRAKESVNIGNLFVMDKQTCITEIGNKVKGWTEINGKLYLTSNTGSTEFSSSADGIQFIKKDSVNWDDKTIIPYGIDLTYYNDVESRAKNVEDLEWHVE
jgi:hypothetical protein